MTAVIAKNSPEFFYLRLREQNQSQTEDIECKVELINEARPLIENPGNWHCAVLQVLRPADMSASVGASDLFFCRPGRNINYTE